MTTVGQPSYRLFVALLILLAALPIRATAASAAVIEAEASEAVTSDENQVCDPVADYYLGMEDYPDAIARHRIVIREHPDNALAHYHLGFAYGMTGHHTLELRQYREAIELGLSDWQLFVNLGIVYLAEGRASDATEVMRLATLLGPLQPATHLNLGLAYERRAEYADAEQEILLSLSLDPNQVDARNTLGLLYAEEGRYKLAREEWSELLAADPDYTPARKNLEILDHAGRETRHAAPHRVVDLGRAR